jgi:dephospho-CoA kinase
VSAVDKPGIGKPFIIGLTGSIGMGKSAAGKMFEDEGIAVFDADAAVHRLQAKGGALVGAIEAAFPGTTADEGVDRQKLGAAVLGDKAQLQLLESIIHPAVAAERKAFFDSHRQDDLILFDIPLLFEKGGADSVDTIVVVSAPAEIQRERVLARPGMTPEKLAKILALQTPDAEKRARADYIIDTSGSLDDTRLQVHKIVTNLRAALAHRNK